MLNFLKIIITTVFAGMLLVVTGCAVHHVPHDNTDYGYGPPPHAPAHGYRAKYHQHDLVYDSHLGVYIVVGFRDHYFHDGYYYRHDRDGWHYSRDLDRDWHKNRNGHLPPGLARKYSNQEHGKYRSDDNGRKGNRDRQHY